MNSERQTRQEKIDLQLGRAGWAVGSRRLVEKFICLAHLDNFPWPETTEKQQTTIEAAAQAVLYARTKHPTSTIADLYDPLTMPPELVRAHQVLDRAVDAAYGKTAFNTEA